MLPSTKTNGKCLPLLPEERLPKTKRRVYHKIGLLFRI